LLRQEGLSIRVIAAATGLGYGTVHRELSGDPNGSPGTVTGRDGKTYPRRGPRGPRPSRAFADRFYRRVEEVQHQVLELDKLSQEEGFAENLDQVRRELDGVVWVREVVDRVLARMQADGPTEP
jgi:hypothetical protein